MLSKEPQSIMKVLFSSFLIYKKAFVAILPISILSVSMHLIARGLVLIDQLWVGVGSFLFFILSFICFCWGICFLYNFIETNDVSYKITFSLTLKRILRVVALFIVGIIFTISLGALVVVVHKLIPASSVILNASYAALVIVLFIPILCFILIAFLEILAKNEGFLASIRKGLKVAFNLESMWRLLSFLLIFMLISLLAFIPVAFLVSFLGWLKLDASVITTATIIFSFFIMIVFLLPFKLNVFINVYNDLVLRSKG